MSETDSDDASEVAKILKGANRPIWVSLLGALALFSGGGTELFNVHNFMHTEAAHEVKQDKSALALMERVAVLEKEAKRAREMDAKTIKMLNEHLALLRARVIALSPKRDRETLRGNFDAQRNSAVELRWEAKRGE